MVFGHAESGFECSAEFSQTVRAKGFSANIRDTSLLMQCAINLEEWRIMGHLAVWKVLEEMIIEFRKKGLPIPVTVMNDLKSARTMIKLSSVDESRGEISQKVEEYLGSVESYLVTEAQKHLAPEYLDGWLRRLEEATCDVCETEEKGKVESKFISGIPRDQKWIRVEPLASLPVEKLQQFAGETNLSSRVQEDGRLLVYGKAEKIKEFIKKMTEQTSKE